MVCFTAGLTRIRPRWLAAAALVGRAPGIALAVLAAATLVGWHFRDRLLGAVRSR